MPANWLPVHREIKKGLAKCDEFMLFGGAGSGKTHFNLNVIFKRAMAMPKSRHICFRKRFEHTKNTTWNSAKEHVVLEWDGLYEQIALNRSGGTWSMTLPNQSEVLFSGLDDKERIEKHLGSEFATIYLNEVSEILDENDVDLIGSRLRQNISGRHLLLMDMNPPPKSHWSYRRFIEDAGKVARRDCFRVNPKDVEENLPASYIERLKALPERLRKRFWDGEFLSDIEGAMWTYEMIMSTREVRHGELGRIVVGVDPAVTANPNSDKTGIVGVGEKGTGYKVLADRSLRANPSTWAAEAVKLYHELGADCIVVEVNQGGDLVETVIRSIDANVKIVKVRATRGKHIRAEPVASLYEQGLVEHAEGLTHLEDQMQSWVPNSGLDSPDEMDALVWAFTELALTEKKVVSVDFF